MKFERSKSIAPDKYPLLLGGGGLIALAGTTKVLIFILRVQMRLRRGVRGFHFLECERCQSG